MLALPLAALAACGGSSGESTASVCAKLRADVSSASQSTPQTAQALGANFIRVADSFDRDVRASKDPKLRAAVATASAGLRAAAKTAASGNTAPLAAQLQRAGDGVSALCSAAPNKTAPDTTATSSPSSSAPSSVNP